VERLDALQKAFEEYFDKEKKRITAQVDFLEAIAKKRGGTVGLQDLNAEGASKVLENSINDYLGRALEPQTGGQQ
jgi:hypothetical protein